MASLRVKLFGPFEVSLDGQAVIGFDSDKVRALLAYLVVEADQPHRREKIATTSIEEVECQGRMERSTDVDRY